MGVTQDALQSRHAVFADEVTAAEGKLTLSATLLKFDGQTCTLTFTPDKDGQQLRWTD